MTQVLIVGGDATYIRDNFGPKLADNGIEVLAHWDWGSKPGKALPPGVAGVILFPAEAAARLTTSARTLARKGKVPIAEVSRQFTQALPALQAVGLVGKVKAEAPVEPEPTEGDIYTLVLNYLKACNSSKKPPTLTETQASVRDTSGLHDLVVPESVYKAALAVARPEAAREALEQEVVAWAKLAIEDSPERSDSDIVQEVLTSFAPKGTDAPTVAAAVAAARKQLLAQWTSHYRYRTAEEIEQYNAMRESYLVRYLTEHLAKYKILPQYKDIRQKCRKVCGGAPLDREIKQIRNRVLALQKVPAGTTRVQVLTAEGAIKFRPPEEVEPTDRVATDSTGKPVVMKAVQRQEPNAPIAGKAVDPDELAAEVARLRSLVTTLAAERDTARTALGQEQAAKEARVVEFKKLTAKMETAANTATQEITKLRTSRQETLERLAGIEKKVTDLSNANDSLGKQVKDLTAQNHALRDDRTTINTQRETAIEALGSANTEVARLTQEVKGLEMTIQDLKASNTALTEAVEKAEAGAKGRGMTLDDIIRLGCSITVTPMMGQKSQD